MTSVSAVASADIRPNFSTQQSTAGDDPFSLLLDAVTDVNVAAPQESPQPERRDDVPAPQAKPETDSQQTKRRAKDSEPADKPKTESAPAPKEAVSDDETEETEETDSGEGDETLVDALLTLTLGEGELQTQTGVQISVDVDGTQTAAAIAATATQIAADAEVELAAAPVVAAAANTADLVEAQVNQTAQLAAGVKANAKAEIANAPTISTDAEAEIALPNVSADDFAKLLKPLKALPSAVEGSAQLQPVTIEASASIPGRALASLEMLNAALTKHLQLSLSVETEAPAPEAQKPVISSNAVMPNFALTAQASASVNAQTQVPTEAARTVPLEALAVEIATRAKNGERRFDIRLDPPELGRIDVRLEIDHKGNTSTKLIVERAETLDLLQRDARGLEKALQSAGLKTDAGGLEFTLRQDAQTQQNQPQAPGTQHRPELAQVEEEVSAQVALGNATLAAQLRGGVDIRI